MVLGSVEGREGRKVRVLRGISLAIANFFARKTQLATYCETPLPEPPPPP